MSCSSTETGSPQVNLSTIRGDSFGFLLRVWEDPAKTIPADLSEATVTAQLRQTPDSEAVEASFHVAVEGHEATLTLLPTETAVLPQMCVWDIQVDWDGSGTSIQTVAHGVLTVGPDVTR
jgi:hypothetical protein